jgi:hypothetical protein
MTVFAASVQRLIVIPMLCYCLGTAKNECRIIDHDAPYPSEKEGSWMIEKQLFYEGRVVVISMRIEL